MKRTENLKIAYESGLFEFIEDRFPGCGIVLFGSYSLGEDTLKSDIDIAVIGCKAKEINLAKFEKLIERTINTQFYDSLKDLDKNLKSNIINGITISGIIEI